MKKEFTPGMYCRFPNEEIPRILDILRANGHQVWKDRAVYTEHSDMIVCINDGDILSTWSPCIEATTELSRHDFMVIALRLEEGMGLMAQYSTIEQRFHIYEELKSLGVNSYPKCTFDDEWGNLAYIKKYDGSGCHVTAVMLNLVESHIPYLYWCQRLCVEPIGEKTEERYPMCEDQQAQIDCRIIDCDHHKCGSCNNVSPAITLNENGTFVCWSKSLKEPTAEPVFDPSKPYEVKNEGMGWYHGDKLLHYVGKTRDGHHAVEISPNNVVTFLDIRNIPEFNASMLEVGEYMVSEERCVYMRIEHPHPTWVNIETGSVLYEDIAKDIKGRRVNVEIKTVEI